MPTVQNITAEVTPQIAADTKRLLCCRHNIMATTTDIIEGRGLTVLGILYRELSEGRNAEWHPLFEASLKKGLSPGIIMALGCCINKQRFNSLLAHVLMTCEDCQIFQIHWPGKTEITFMATNEPLDELAGSLNSREFWAKVIRTCRIRTNEEAYWS